MIDTIIVEPKLTSAERLFLFRKVSESKESIPLDAFVRWIDKCAKKRLKPLINLNVKLNSEFGNSAETSQEAKIPLVIKKLVEEMREYGLQHVKDGFDEYVSESIAELSKKKEYVRKEKAISLTNFQRFLSVLNIDGTAVEDLHELRNWLLENSLAERYVILGAPEIGIEIIINSDKIWNALIELYKIPSTDFRPELSGTTPEELNKSIKESILRKKLNGIGKVIFCGCDVNNRY